MPRPMYRRLLEEGLQLLLGERAHGARDADADDDSDNDDDDSDDDGVGVGHADSHEISLAAPMANNAAPSSSLAIGVDLGGTHVLAVLMDRQGVLARQGQSLAAAAAGH